MKNKKTKIVATLGPATSSKAVLKEMLDEGANVFRINFSHADYDGVKERIKIIRELNEEFGYNAAILADLQGPKLRVGVMKGEVIVNEGDEIIFATGERFEGTKERVYMTYDNFPQDAKQSMMPFPLESPLCSYKDVGCAARLGIVVNNPLLLAAVCHDTPPGP